MASLEGDVMRSVKLVCEVVKDTVSSNIHASAARGDFELTNEAFAKIDKIIRSSVDLAFQSSSRQVQAVLREHEED
jgi:hypothetical protein